MTAARRAAVVAVVSFVALGLPESVLATAWPDMASDASRPLGDLRWLLVSYTAGYLVSSAPAGLGVRRLGVRTIGAVGVGLSIVGLFLYATSPGWGWLISAGLLLGLGAGQLDTAMNVWATTRGARTMNLMHAAFGVGTTIGPPLTIAAAAVFSWRGAYVVLIVFDLVLLAAVWLIGPEYRPHTTHERDEVAPRDSARLPTLAIVATFGVYVAVEATAGAWGYSYLREHQEMSPAAAGFGLAAYWAGLTLGRVSLGVVGAGLPPRAVLAWGATGATIACGVIVIATGAGTVVGLIVLGLALSGIFPALMLVTPLMVGTQRAPLVVGWSLSASGISFALAAVVVGQQVNRSGLGVVPANLLIGALTLLALVAALLRLQTTPAHAASSAAPGSATTTTASANSNTRGASGR